MFLRICFFLGGGGDWLLPLVRDKKGKRKKSASQKKGFGEVVGVWGFGSPITVRRQAQTDQPKVQGKMNFSVRVRMRVAGFLFTQDSVLE